MSNPNGPESQTNWTKIALDELKVGDGMLEYTSEHTQCHLSYLIFN